MTTRVLCLAAIALVVSPGVAPAPVLARTAAELVLEADRLLRGGETFPDSVERAVGLYQEAAQIEPTNGPVHVKLAQAALELGDAAGRDALRWYELGQTAAERAVALDPDRAQAHFLLAAHRGNVAKRRPLLEVSPRIVGELEEHLRRALAIDPRHARALHMMGVLLRDTPAFLRGYLKGRKGEVGGYLAAAVAADPDYAPARLDLAEHHRSAGRIADARAQANAVLEVSRPARGRVWRERHRPAAEALLKRLPPE